MRYIMLIGILLLVAACTPKDPKVCETGDTCFYSCETSGCVNYDPGNDDCQIPPGECKCTRERCVFFPPQVG